MKNRDYKTFAANQYFHIFNRGIGKMDILKEALYPQRTVLYGEDRPLRSRYVPKSLPEGAYSLLSYCLMPNHFHFLIRQNSEFSLSKLWAKVFTSYCMYFNKKYDHVGALLQSKFKAVTVTSDAQLLWLSSYIHNNPLTANLVSNLQDWQWSSYLDYMDLRQGTLVDKNFILKIFNYNLRQYENFVYETGSKIRERKELEHLLLD